MSSLRARRLAASLLLLCLFSLGTEAQKIRVEYDKNLDFSKFKTFSWGKHDAVSRPTLALAIAGAIQAQLVKQGLQPVESNPDLYIQMYGSVDTDVAVSYSDLYYGMGGFPPFDQNFLMWGAVPGSTTMVSVHKGQLVVDLIDASQKKLVWRGMASEKLSDKKQKLVEQVNTAVDKMFRQYPTTKK
jgi:hypothetical protein